MFMHKIRNKTHLLNKLEFIKKPQKDKPQRTKPQKEKPQNFPLHLLGDRARSQFLHLSK